MVKRLFWRITCRSDPIRRIDLSKFIQDGRIFIGPWYILQDAFLTSGEANVRNMQIGHQDAKNYGDVVENWLFS